MLGAQRGHHLAMGGACDRRPSEKKANTSRPFTDRLTELPERARRQGRRDQRDQQRVCGLEHTLGDERNTRGAVKEHPVVVTAQGREHPRDPARGPLGCVQGEIHMAVGEVRGQQIQALEIGPFDQLGDRALASHQPTPSAADLRLDPEQIRRSALGVEVPQQHPRTFARRQIREVDSSRRLAHAALDVVGREDVAQRNVSLTSLRCALDENSAKRSANSSRAAASCSSSRLDVAAHRHRPVEYPFEAALRRRR